MGWKLPRIEGNRADYREDPRWVHPELVNYENWQGSPRNTDIGAVLTDPDRPIEERKKARLEFSEGVAAKLKEAESRLPESVRNQGVWKEFRGMPTPTSIPMTTSCRLSMCSCVSRENVPANRCRVCSG